jgi:hypothetical protein
MSDPRKVLEHANQGIVELEKTRAALTTGNVEEDAYFGAQALRTQVKKNIRNLAARQAILTKRVAALDRADLQSSQGSGAASSSDGRLESPNEPTRIGRLREEKAPPFPERKRVQDLEAAP